MQKRIASTSIIPHIHSHVKRLEWIVLLFENVLSGKNTAFPRMRGKAVPFCNMYWTTQKFMHRWSPGFTHRNTYCNRVKGAAGGGCCRWPLHLYTSKKHQKLTCFRKKFFCIEKTRLIPCGLSLFSATARQGTVLCLGLWQNKGVIPDIQWYKNQPKLCLWSLFYTFSS